MAHLSESVDNSDWSMPSSVVEVGVIKGSKPASLPSSSTPSSDIVKELFVKGTQPNAVTKQYQEEVKEEKEEKKETLPAPTGLSASYDAEANEINISWDAYSIENEDGEASYAITVGGQTATTGDTSYVVQNPSEGSVEISLTASVGDQTSPAASVQVTVPSSEEESEESESSESSSEESSEPESSESSSSSEESSEESSSEESSEESSSSESESSSSSSSSSSEEPSDETENNEN